MKICISCDKPAVPGKARCQPCLDSAAAYQKEYQAHRKQSGICTDCGKASATGKVYCPVCSDKRNATSRERYARNRSNGLCGHCGKESVPDDHSLCPKCLAMYRDGVKRREATSPRAQAKERDNNTCQLCGRQLRIAVHHIDEVGEKLPRPSRTRQKPNNHLSNLISLCYQCHGYVTLTLHHNVDISLLEKLSRHESPFK